MSKLIAARWFFRTIKVPRKKMKSVLFKFRIPLQLMVCPLTLIKENMQAATEKKENVSLDESKAMASFGILGLLEI